MSVDIMRVINSKMSFIVIYHKQKKTFKISLTHFLMRVIDKSTSDFPIFSRL